MSRIPAWCAARSSTFRPALDPNTRTLQARIEAPNPGERLKKEMYVTAEVQAGVIPNALFVPNSTVLRDDQNMPYVYLQTGSTQFARRDVTLGETEAGKTQVLTGLQASDNVVGDGRFSCNSRIRSSAEKRTRASDDSPCRPIRSSAALPDPDAGGARGGRWRALLPAACRSTPTRTFPPTRRNNHAVARARGRKRSNGWSRCHRAPDERRAAHGVHALDLIVWPVRRHHDVRRQRGQLFRPASCIREALDRQPASGRNRQPGAALEPVQSGLSLCD